MESMVSMQRANLIFEPYVLAGIFEPVRIAFPAFNPHTQDLSVKSL
jgi:hypothetical protein